MPNPYEIIDNYRPDFGVPYQKAIAKLTEFEIKTTPGWKLINQNPVPQTPADVFNKLVREIHPVGKWCGNKSAAYRLLGGVSYEGECALFANSFAALLTAPKPFGLQISSTLVEVVTWKGLHKNGFVVKHPKVLMGLEANVARDKSASLVDSPALHFWDNHKVVKYNDVFYDVCYGCTWQSDAEAIVFHVCQNPTKDETVYACEPTNLANSIKLDGKNLSPSQVVFFKQTSTQPRICYQGPLGQPG